MSSVIVTETETIVVVSSNAWGTIGGNIADQTDLGTAATQDVGTSASNVVQLDGSARLPAVDGSQLTGLTPAQAGADPAGTAAAAVAAHESAPDPHPGYATDGDLSDHLGDFTNPHAVTAAQAGAEPTGAVATHAALTTTHGVTGALVGSTDAQELTNKTIESLTNSVHANSIHTKIHNQTGSTIYAGQPLRVTSWEPGEEAERVAPANQATGVANYLAEEDIAHGAYGAAIAAGVLTGIDTLGTGGGSAYTDDTGGWNEGTILFVNGSGKLTSTEPTTGYSQPIAMVIRAKVDGALHVLASYPKQDAADVRYDATSSVADHIGDSTIHFTQAAISITEAQISDLQAYLTAESDPVFIASEAASFVAGDKSKLDGIEAGATADQTAAEILTAIKTVDGAASGLDADLLDGQHGSYYLAWANLTDVPTLSLTGPAPEETPRHGDLGSAAYAELKQAQDQTSVGWRDLVAPLSAAGVPATSAPNMTAFGPAHTPQREEYAFSVGDYLFCQPFHVNHDVKRGGAALVHVHWSTDGTSTATVKWELTIMRALGHDQANFGTPVVKTVEQAAAGTAWRHMVAEVDLADALTLTEPDELILVTVRRITNGGTDNADSVFGLTIDFHYQSDRHSTANRAPNFFGE